MVYLTTGEAAQLLNLTTRTIQRYINKGIIKAHKLPGRGNNRIALQDFTTFCEAHEVPVPGQLLAIEEAPKVLIIEDDIPMLKSIARVIKQAQWEPIMATDGFQAGALLNQHQPQVMTLDVNMPGINGLDILRFTREQGEYASLKIILISADANNLMHTAISAGADAVIQKPFKNETLLNTIAELINDA
jgi:excisionase family DNA binding protein